MDFLKLCNTCGQQKLLVDFYDRTNNKTMESCKECMARIYYQPHYKKYKEKYLENTKKWRAENPEKAAASRKAYESTPEIKLRKKVRNTMTRRLRSDQEFRDYIESLFTDGQSWKNYSDEWTISFKVPLKEFDLSDPEYFAKASAFENVIIKSLKN